MCQMSRKTLLTQLSCVENTINLKWCWFFMCCLVITGCSIALNKVCCCSSLCLSSLELCLLRLMMESPVGTTYELRSRTSSCDSSCEWLGQSFRCIVDHRCCREGVRRRGCRTGIGSRILPSPSLFHGWGYNSPRRASHQWGRFSATSTCHWWDPPMFLDQRQWTAY